MNQDVGLPCQIEFLEILTEHAFASVHFQEGVSLSQSIILFTRPFEDLGVKRGVHYIIDGNSVRDQKSR